MVSHYVNREFAEAETQRLEELERMSKDMSGLNPTQGQELKFLRDHKWKDIDWRDIIEADHEVVKRNRLDPHIDRGQRVVLEFENNGLSYFIEAVYDSVDEKLTLRNRGSTFYEESVNQEDLKSITDYLEQFGLDL